MEVMVGSAVMSAVMALATSGFVTMYHTTDLAESATQTQTALLASFDKLDREVRYACRVNAPTMAGGSYHVDYVVSDSENARQCVRLSLPVDGGDLTRRQWPQALTSTDPAATVGTVAADVVPAVPGVNPFRVRPAGEGDSNFDRLGVKLTSTVGVTGIGDTRSYDLQFTALNTQPLSTTITCAT